MISGNCSFSSSCGSGSGSGDGGVDSLLFLVGYFRGSGGGAGVVFSFCSVDLPRVKRSRALAVLFGSDSVDDFAEPCRIASAFFRRSSASLASLLEPPSSLGVGRLGCEGTSFPASSAGTLFQETFANQPPVGGAMSRGGLQSSRTSQSTCLSQRDPPQILSRASGPAFRAIRNGNANSPPNFLALSSCAWSNLLLAFSFVGGVLVAGALGCFEFFR